MLKRVHNSGTESLLIQHENEKTWRIQINLREADHSPMTITGYLATTLEKAKELADHEVLKHGHVCSADCRDWEESASADGKNFQ
jgi:hypothetical protein